MIRPSVYLAGKIDKNGWRGLVVPALREHGWKDGPIHMESFIYTGPFFHSCDHGCNHGPNGHGAANGFHFDESPYTQHDVIRNNNSALDSADLVFAYITSADCYGTLIELGYAIHAGKRVALAFSPSFPHKDFWYASLQADVVYFEVRPCCLVGLIKKEVKAL
jgi:hypothetical protein